MSFGQRKLAPIELTEDEAESLLTGLELLIQRDEYEDAGEAILDSHHKLYDKIKEAK